MLEIEAKLILDFEWSDKCTYSDIPIYWFYNDVFFYCVFIHNL